MHACMRPLVTMSVFLTPILGGCGESTSPEDLPGTYSAVEFSARDNGADMDLLAGGATLTISLSANGTTSGTLYVPGGGEIGEDLNASMTGTWMYDENTGIVVFDQNADTFVRDAMWSLEGDRLETTFNYDDGDFVAAVLERQ